MAADTSSTSGGRTRGASPESGSALIITLVFLVVFAVIATLVADFAYTTFRASDAQAGASETLFGADDVMERTQHAIETSHTDFDGCLVPDLSLPESERYSEATFRHEDETYKVRCTWLDYGANPLPGMDAAMYLFGKTREAFVKHGDPAVYIAGDVRLNSDMICFRNHADGYVAGLGHEIPCENPPDLTWLPGLDPYRNNGPIRFRPDRDGEPASVEIALDDCPADGSWYPDPLAYTGAAHNPAYGGDHLSEDGPDTTDVDGDGNTAEARPFTERNWRCRAGSDKDLVQFDKNFTLPNLTDTALLPSRSSSGTPIACQLVFDLFTFRFRQSCVREFQPGTYATAPNLSIYPDGTYRMRANVFRPGVYWFAGNGTGITPWYPDGGFNLSLRTRYEDAPVVMGVPHDAIVNTRWWGPQEVVDSIPITDRCKAGQPGVQVVFPPGRGIWVNYTSTFTPRGAELMACPLLPSQADAYPGARPNVVLYQRKYEPEVWAAGFTNWPDGIARPEAPAFSTFALFNSAENILSGGVVLDGIIYAPQGMVSVAVGLFSSTDVQLAKGLFAWGLRLKAVGAGGTILADEEQLYTRKMQIAVKNCHEAPDCDVTVDPDVRALVNADPDIGAPVKIDRWLPR